MYRLQIQESKKTWREAHVTLRNRFLTTQPGLIHGACHNQDDEWTIQVKVQAETGQIKTQNVPVDTAFIHCEFGAHYAKFVLKRPALSKGQFHDVPGGKTIRINNKPIAGIKFVPGSEIKIMVPYERTIPVKQQKVPEYNETVLGGGKLKRKSMKP